MNTRHLRRRSLAGAALALASLGTLAAVPAASAATPAAPYQGTLVQQRADSQVIRIGDDYYFTGTVPEYDRLILRHAKTLEGLASAPEMVIWNAHGTAGAIPGSDPEQMANHIWAPEVHFLDGKWYVYFAAGHRSNPWNIGMYVLECAGPDPLVKSCWTEKGQIASPVASTFALDATTFDNPADHSRYLVWAQYLGSDSDLWLAKLANPWTLAGAPVLISKPEYDWEIQGYRVNEGPAVLQRNGKIFITYSASATDGRYALGMLTVDATANLLDPTLWRPDTQAKLDQVKSRQPVFQASADNGQFGPGHNSFTVADDGTTDILVYHDRDYTFTNDENVAPGACNQLSQPHQALTDVNRRTRVQTFSWNADGTPHFGTPVADPAPIRLRLHSAPDRYVRHYNFVARLDADPNPSDATSVFRQDSSFRVVPGLAGGNTVSLESTNFPSCFLSVGTDQLIHVYAAQSDADYVRSASFVMRPGLAGAGTSFESVATPGGYLHRRADDQLHLDQVTSAADRPDATFDLIGTPVLPAPDPVTNPSTSASASASSSATPSASATPSTSASPSASAAPPSGPSASASGAAPTTGAGTGPAGNGGGLPVTGTNVAIIAGTGLAVLGLGLLLILLGRHRHRHRRQPE